MKKKNIENGHSVSPIHTGGGVENIIQEFNDVIKTLGETKDFLEREIVDMRKEVGNLGKEKSVLEADLDQSRDTSEIAMAAKASEEEKRDAIKKNQELRSYLESAADQIKVLDMNLAKETNEMKRLEGRIETLESEKISLVKEKESCQSKVLGMNDIILEQDYKIKNLNLHAESLKDDKTILEKEVISSRKSQDEIQKSLNSIKDKLKWSELKETHQTQTNDAGDS